MGRHTGGQVGFEYQRAECHFCHRKISGGRVVERPGYWIRLRKHGRGKTCPGSYEPAEVKM